MNNLQHTYGKALFWVGLVFYLQSNLYDFWLLAHRNDFGHLYCGGALAALKMDFYSPDALRWIAGVNGIRTVNPFVYPPFFAIALIPLTWFTYNGAWLIFSVLSHMAFFLSIHLLVKIFRRDEPAIFWWGVFLFIAGIFDPLPRTYFAGQVNTFMLLVLTYGWYALSKKQETIAGIALGIGAAIKLTPAFFLLYLVWRKHYKAAASLVVTVVLSLAVSIAALGLDIHKTFLHEAARMSYGSSTWSDLGMHFHVEPHNQAPAAFWYRLLTHNATTEGVIDSPAAAKGMAFLTAAVVLFLLLFKTERNEQDSPDGYALWIFGMLLLPSLMWDHYLVQLFFPLAVMVRLVLDGQVRFLYAGVTGLALISVQIINYFDFPVFKSGILTIFMSLKLYGVVLLFIFLLRNKDDHTISTS